ncbi:MAG TPA: hypothetical protein VN918_10680 [Myxococcaceae bacterium]|nr:hypothetical protein [Myxococcaceae bacterium]
MAVLLLLGIPAMASVLLSTPQLQQMRCVILSAMGEALAPLVPSAVGRPLLTSLESHFGKDAGGLLSCRSRSRCPLVSRPAFQATPVKAFRLKGVRSKLSMTRHRGRLVWIL